MRGRRRDSEVSLCIKYFLFFSNVLFWLIGVLISGVGLWARVAYVKENSSLGLLSGWDFDPAIIFIFVGAIIFLLGFCGCVGALRENICLLKFFAISLSIIFFVQLAAGALGFVFRRKIQGLVTSKLAGTIVNYRSNPNLQDIIDYSQTTFKCCGLQSYKDWRKNVYFNCTLISPEACSVPYSCCRENTLNKMCGYKMNRDSMPPAVRSMLIYTRGCTAAITQWFLSHLKLIGSVAFGVALFQIIVIILTTRLISDIRRQMAKWSIPGGSFHEPLYHRDM